MKIIKICAVFALVTINNLLLAQTDSIYSLTAKIENGRLKASFLSSYDISKVKQVFIEVFDETHRNVASFYATKGENNSFFSKTGNVMTQIEGNGKLRFVIDESLFERLKDKKSVSFEFHLKGEGIAGERLIFSPNN